MSHIRVAVLALCLFAGAGAGSSVLAQGTGVIKFQNLKVDQVLEMYKGITQSELIIASNVKQAGARITAGNGPDLKTDDAARLLEQALLRQAGVVITRLEGKRVSVTYNDRLELAPGPGQ